GAIANFGHSRVLKAVIQRDPILPLCWMDRGDSGYRSGTRARKLSIQITPSRSHSPSHRQDLWNEGPVTDGQEGT
ncbi:MAG: hypothetical protein ACPG7R_03635, partial [Planctomycetota bacterium]